MTSSAALSADVTEKPAAETNQSQKAPEDKGTASPLFVPNEKQEGPAEDKAADDKADYYAKADLNAQERMAAEAERLAELTDSQLTLTVIQAVLLGLALIAAGVAAFAAVSAAKSGKKIVAVTRDSAERQLRAYVDPDSAEFIDISSTPPKIQVKIKNYGQTPAYNVRCALQCVFTTTTIDREAVEFIDEDWSPLGVISPSKFIGCVMTLENPTVSPQQITALLQGRATLYLFGEVRYRDVFDIPHQSVCKMKFGGTAPISAEYKFALCAEGNDAD